MIIDGEIWYVWYFHFILFSIGVVAFCLSTCVLVAMPFAILAKIVKGLAKYVAQWGKA